MSVALLFLLLAGEGSVVDLKRVAGEMAAIGMPVDVAKVKLRLIREWDAEPELPPPPELSPSERRRLLGHEILARLMGFSTPDRPALAGWFEPLHTSLGLWVRGSPTLVGIDGVVVHELAHAYQHQKHKLFRPRAWRSTDQDWVRVAVIEGEAEAAVVRHLFRKRKKTLGSVEAADFVWRAGIGGGGVFLPYQVGARHALQWPTPGDLHAHRPQTSEALLHPGCPARREPTAPTWIELPKAELLLEDTWGEIGIYHHLAAPLKRSEATMASIGWDGDRLRVYRSKAHGDFAVWVTHWDREIDAIEFERALRKVSRGSFTRRGRRLVWVGTDKVKLGETLWDRVLKLPRPPPENRAEAEFTRKVQARALATCTPSEKLVQRRWRLGDSGISLEVPPGWWIARTSDGFVPQFKAPGKHPGFLAVDAWPRGLFEDGKDLERFLSADPLSKVIRVEPCEVGLLVERRFYDDRRTEFARSVELFVFAPRMLIHIYAWFASGAVDEETDPVRKALRTVRIKES